MRKFADIHLKLFEMNDAVLTRTAKLIRDMGIDIVGIVVPQTLKQFEMSRIRTVLTKTGINVATRVDLNPKNRNQLLSDLRSVRKRFEIVAVECRSHEVAAVACRDRRVDIISLPINNRRITYRMSLGGRYRASLEINVAELISTGNLPRHVVLSRLRDVVSKVKSNHIPIVLSSGADNPLLLRAPREIAAIGTVLGMQSAEALDAVSTTPIAIVELNRKKLSHEYVTTGVKIER